MSLGNGRLYVAYNGLAHGPTLATQVGQGGLSDEETVLAVSNWIASVWKPSRIRCTDHHRLRSLNQLLSIQDLLVAEGAGRRFTLGRSHQAGYRRPTYCERVDKSGRQRECNNCRLSIHPKPADSGHLL